MFVYMLVYVVNIIHVYTYTRYAHCILAYKPIRLIVIRIVYIGEELQISASKSVLLTGKYIYTLYTLSYTGTYTISYNTHTKILIIVILIIITSIEYS